MEGGKSCGWMTRCKTVLLAELSILGYLQVAMVVDTVVIYHGTLNS